MTPRRGSDVDVDVAIVGAGASGLFLAARLARQGVRVAVFERRLEPTAHSRAIGIHPPGLAALDRIGAAQQLLDEGIRVRRGLASAGTARTGIATLGVLDFSATLDGPFPFVLTVPQWRTEAALEAVLAEARPGALRRGVRVEGWRDEGDRVQLHVTPARASDAAATPDAWTARLVVLATGARGGAAGRLGIATEGGRYDDAYVMGDHPDGDLHQGVAEPFDRPLGDDAAIHLAPDGVVEAFPLPGGMRRWVAKTAARIEEPRPEQLARLVAERTGAALDPAAFTMLSSFGVERRLAARLTAGRVWLAGDAAHVVAPIGGQGMTLAWLGAERLVEAWTAHADGRATLDEAATGYDHDQRRLALQAGTRAAWNLRMGRATRWDRPRRWLVRALLSPPLAPRMARTFTMQA